ncbi:hypothetical protein FRC09_015907, partial [Ceratobasidium sp. 395]
MSRSPLLASAENEEVAEGDSGLEATSFAPIEDYSPLGYNVGLFNATLLNTSAIRQTSQADWNWDILNIKLHSQLAWVCGCVAVH